MKKAPEKSKANKKGKKKKGDILRMNMSKRQQNILS
jgi:hypothetical protein